MDEYTCKGTAPVPTASPTSDSTASVAAAPADTEHVLTLTVTLPYTKAEFTETKLTLYKLAVAKTAGTVASNVDILSVTETTRRAGSVAVETQIHAPDAAGLRTIKSTLGGGDSLKTKLDTELKAQGLEASTAVTAPIAVNTSTGVRHKASAAVLVQTAATVCVSVFFSV